MLELSYNESIQIDGGAPTKDTSLVYDIVYLFTRFVLWGIDEGAHVNKHLIHGSALHPGS